MAEAFCPSKIGFQLLERLVQETGIQLGILPGTQFRQAAELRRELVAELPLPLLIALINEVEDAEI